MSSWNFRVVARENMGEPEFTIVETYYDDEGNVDGWTDDPAWPTGLTLEDLRGELRLMLEATEKPLLKTGQEDSPSSS